MLSKLIFALVAIGSFNVVVGQNSNQSGNRDKLFEVSSTHLASEFVILDSSIQGQIMGYAEGVSLLDSTFKTYGYLIMTIEPRKGSGTDNFNKCYTIFPSLAYIYTDANELNMPLFYSYINKRLVLVYVKGIKNTISNNKIRKKFASIVNRTLPKEQPLWMPDPETGKKIKVRPIGGVFLHTSKTFCFD